MDLLEAIKNWQQMFECTVYYLEAPIRKHAEAEHVCMALKALDESLQRLINEADDTREIPFR